MSGADNTASVRHAQQENIPNIHKVAKTRAYRVTDDDDGCAIVFAACPTEAHRLGAAELDIEFTTVLSCERAPEFDSFADRGFVPAKELIAAGWWFECLGCSRNVDRDMDGYDADDNHFDINPIYEDHGVWCTPECKAADAQDRRIRKSMEAAAIADFQRRVLKRFPGVEFEGQQHAFAAQRNGRYALEQVVASFRFPGQQIAPAQYRYDNCGSWTKYGPPDPHYECCSGDREAFEELSRMTMQTPAWEARS
jgi:hypothetical protein